MGNLYGTSTTGATQGPSPSRSRSLTTWRTRPQSPRRPAAIAMGWYKHMYTYGGLHSHGGYPKLAGWFYVMENPHISPSKIRMRMMTGGTPIEKETPLYIFNEMIRRFYRVRAMLEAWACHIDWFHHQRWGCSVSRIIVPSVSGFWLVGFNGLYGKPLGFWHVLANMRWTVWLRPVWRHTPSNSNYSHT